jgi:hypothetical protein
VAYFPRSEEFPFSFVTSAFYPVDVGWLNRPAKGVAARMKNDLSVIFHCRLYIIANLGREKYIRAWNGLPNRIYY